MNRRKLLRRFGVTVIAGFAGCNAQDETNPRTGSPSDTATPTQPPVDDRAPTILDYTATPEQNGTVLAVSMEGEDDRGLETARISYGERKLIREPDGTTVTIDGTLQDTAVTSPEDGRVAFILTDAAGNETQKQVQPDETAPELAVETRPTTNAGKAVLTITASDDTGLGEVHDLLDGQTVRSHETAGSTEYNDERTVSAPEEQRFQRTPVGARAQDWNGNRTEKDIETYVRKYTATPENEQRLDIGAQYMPHMGDAFDQGCIVKKEPIVGPYDDPIRPETISRHIDQMTGHGIGRLPYNWEGFGRSEERLDNFLSSGLLGSIEVNPIIGFNALRFSRNQSWKDDVLPHDLGIIHDRILANDEVNAATYDGRPLVATWSWQSLVTGKDHTKLMDEYNGYDAFVNDVRSHLTVDGTEPFLIGGISVPGWEEAYDHPEIEALASQFDGVSNWTADVNNHTGETYHWNEVIPIMETTYRTHHEFVTDNGMEFIPVVFPGFDDRGNTCWGPTDEDGNRLKRHIPRNQDRLQEMLHLAEQYATADIIDIATWNDWAEGHQIEPGTHRGNDYGTAYLDAIEEFQTG